MWWSAHCSYSEMSTRFQNYSVSNYSRFQVQSALCRQPLYRRSGPVLDILGQLSYFILNIILEGWSVILPTLGDEKIEIKARMHAPSSMLFPLLKSCHPLPAFIHIQKDHLDPLPAGKALGIFMVVEKEAHSLLETTRLSQRAATGPCAVWAQDSTAQQVWPASAWQPAL